MRAFLKSATRKLAIGATAAVVIASFSVGGADARPQGWQGIFGFNGHQYTVRRASDGNQLSLRFYRKVGNQWEPYGTVRTTRAKVESGRNLGLLEQIYANGVYLGQNPLDLDNRWNTHLNLHPGQ